MADALQDLREALTDMFDIWKQLHPQIVSPHPKITSKMNDAIGGIFDIMEHGDLPADLSGLQDKLEVFTCANKHLAAERLLLMIERLIQQGNPMPDSETLDMLDTLARIAGPENAKKAITDGRLLDKVPF